MKSKEIGISWSYRSSTLLPIVRRPYSPKELNVSEETILVNSKLTASCPTNMSPNASTISNVINSKNEF